MTYDVYLVCLTGGDSGPIEAIKRLWPDGHVHTTTEQYGVTDSGDVEILIVAAERKNGVLLVKDVYDRIQAECGGTDFQCLIVPISDSFFGFWRTSLWAAG